MKFAMTEKEYLTYFNQKYWKTSSFTSGFALAVIDCLMVMISIGTSFFIINLINHSWINFRSFITYWIYLLPMISVFYAAGLYPGISLPPADEVKKFAICSFFVFTGIALSITVEEADDKWPIVVAFILATPFALVFLPCGRELARHLLKNNISLYGKIIGVACSFEAITAPRNFREARTTYEGMIEMLKNSNHLYDETVIKALLYSISLFPIGAFVFLSNGRVGQVVDVSPASPKNPIVQIVGSVNPDGTPKRIQTDDKTIRIVRTMNKEESDDLRKSLGDTL